MGNKKDYYHGSNVKARGSYFRHDGTTYVDIELTAGMFKVVADVAARDALLAGKRSEGLTVFVVSEKMKYQLIGGIDNANWVALNLYKVFPNAGSGAITIGDITREKAIILSYVMERGSLMEVGEIMVTNKADTLVSRSDDFDYCGIEFEKLLDGNNITLSWTDTLSDGDDVSFWCSVNRLMF